MQVRTRKKISEILPGQKNNEEDVMAVGVMTKSDDKVAASMKEEPSASPDRDLYQGPYVDGSPVA